MKGKGGLNGKGGKSYRLKSTRSNFPLNCNLFLNILMAS